MPREAPLGGMRWAALAPVGTAATVGTSRSPSRARHRLRTHRRRSWGGTPALGSAGCRATCLGGPSRSSPSCSRFRSCSPGLRRTTTRTYPAPPALRRQQLSTGAARLTAAAAAPRGRCHHGRARGIRGRGEQQAAGHPGATVLRCRTARHSRRQTGARPGALPRHPGTNPNPGTTRWMHSAMASSGLAPPPPLLAGTGTRSQGCRRPPGAPGAPACPLRACRAGPPGPTAVRHGRWTRRHPRGLHRGHLARPRVHRPRPARRPGRP